MIRFRGLDNATEWSVRFDSSSLPADNDIVIPPVRRRDIGNQAGSIAANQWGWAEKGQLVVLGLHALIKADALDEGFQLLERSISDVPATTDTVIFTATAGAAGHVIVDKPELFIPLRGHSYGAGTTGLNASRLAIALVGTPSLVELVAWGVWTDCQDLRGIWQANSTAAPAGGALNIRPQTV